MKTTVYYEIGCLHGGDTIQSWHPDTFDTLAQAQHAVITEYRNRKKGDGHDHYWNTIGIRIEKKIIIVETVFEQIPETLVS